MAMPALTIVSNKTSERKNLSARRPVCPSCEYTLIHSFFIDDRILSSTSNQKIAKYRYPSQHTFQQRELTIPYKTVTPAKKQQQHDRYFE
jgi:hypothetical protein